MLSRESIDKKKINRLKVIHTRRREACFNVFGFNKRKTSISKLDEENKVEASLDALNLGNDASSSILSKNLEEKEQKKEAKRVGDFERIELINLN